MRQSGDPPEVLVEPGHLRRQRFQRPLLLEHVERGQGGGRAQRIAAVGVPVIERLALGVFSQKRLPYLVGRQRGGHRQIAAGHALGDAKQVGRNAFVFAGEHPAGAPEADGHLVGDQQDVVLPRQLAHAAQIALRVHDHARRRLNQRFDHHGGDLLVMFGQHLVQLRQMILAKLFAGDAGRRAVRVGRRNAKRLEQQRSKRGVELLDPADAHAAECIAVIRFAERHVAGL